MFANCPIHMYGSEHTLTVSTPSPAVPGHVPEPDVNLAIVGPKGGHRHICTITSPEEYHAFLNAVVAAGQEVGWVRELAGAFTAA